MTSRLATWVLLAGTLPLTLAEAARADKPSLAKGRTHWAFQPVKPVLAPAVSDAAWLRTPIDAFVLARLEARQLKPAPPADRRTLLRRVYLDVIGLPPTPAEQQAFLQDPSPDAYEHVVDDLLSRPQYGERWARHWLDVARYAETNGYERDGPKPHAWRYRDYVIDALNKDKPYDRFLTEQIAGDELPNSNAETQIATTFLRLGTWDDEPAEFMLDRYEQLDDVLGTTAAAFMGVTLRCARCHDHKFEPFSQVDYYRMLAVFEPLKRPEVIVSATHRKEHECLVGTEMELAAYRRAVAKPQAEISRLQEKIDSVKKAVGERLIVTLSSKPSAKKSSLPADAVTAFLADPDKRTSKQKTLMKKFGDMVEREIRAASTAEEGGRLQDWEKQLAAWKAVKPPEPPSAYIWYEDTPQAPKTHVLRRGDPLRPIKEVGPGFPAVLAATEPAPPQPTAKSTGRRLWLARWLIRPEHPLTARVIVNRIWQQHFGQGLVASANDFGVMGDRPTHPELLDWLAGQLVAGGWRLKPLHRAILLSNVYQTSAVAAPETATVDPQGNLLASWRQRRLQAEAIRDSILAASGRLNPQMAGPSVYPRISRAVLEGQSRPGDGWGQSDERQAARRSVYVYIKRVLPVPELELLDAPDTTSSCEQRQVATTAPQALTFLNGEFIQEQSRYFAARLEHEVGTDSQAQVRRAFELALCRPPRTEEMQAALKFLDVQKRQIDKDASAANARSRALAAFCLVLLNTNEFVYLN